MRGFATSAHSPLETLELGRRKKKPRRIRHSQKPVGQGRPKACDMTKGFKAKATEYHFAAESNGDRPTQRDYQESLG